MLKNKSAKKKVNKELLRRPDVYVTALSSKNELKAARTATTGEKFDTLDERIDCEVDRLNKKIDVTMLQQEDKENHTIENTVEGMSTDMVIKGRTLQNLSLSNENKWRLTGEYAVRVYKYDLLKPNTKYTFILEKFPTGADTPTWFINANGIEDSYGNNLIKVVTTSNTFAHESTIHVMVRNPVLENIDSNYNPNLIILEGDWTNKPIPQYFEGIKSFGEKEDKISILSSGKNLLKKELDTVGQEITIPKIGDYTFSFDSVIEGGRCGVYIIYEGKTLVSKAFNNGRVNLTLNIQQTEGLIVKVGAWDSGSKVVSINNSMMVEGVEATSYESYKSDKKDILLSQYGFDEGLRGFDTNSCDVLNDVSKKAIKRIEKDIITGNEDFQKAGNANYYFLIGNNHKPLSKTLNNKYPDKNCSNVEESGLWCGNAYKLCIKDLSVNTVEELKTKLKQWYVEENPLIIYYELAEPVETPLSENINLKTFREKTYISFENAISGTSSFKAPVDTTATIARLNRENRSLEEENKTLRQDFESTTLTLTDSDLELVKQNVDMDFRLMEVEFALDIPQAILSSNIKFKNKKGEVKSMARTPYEMMKIVILSGDYDREDYMHKVGKYYERGRMTKEEHDELMSLMTADEVISK